MPPMQVSPSASLFQALSNVAQTKRPTPVAQFVPNQQTRQDAAPRTESPTRNAGQPARPGRMGQVIDIQV